MSLSIYLQGLTLVALLFKITKSKMILLWAFFVSIFLDIDHLLDYLLTLGFTFDLHAIAEGSYFDISKHTIIPFHSWETAIAFCILGWVKKRKKVGLFILATGLGMGIHLTVDQIWYNAPWGSYFLIVRFLHNFTSPTLW